MAWLRVIEGKARGATYLLDEGLRTAGRDAGNPIHLDDGQASDAHARFEWGQGQHRISDLNSRNGTTVNGRALPVGHPHALGDQDRVKIGATC